MYRDLGCPGCRHVSTVMRVLDVRASTIALIEADDATEW